MKRKIAAWSLVITLCLLCGCGKVGQSKDLLAKIQEKGTITVAMEGNWAPWTYEDENGTLMGFEVEVASAVAEKLGVKAEFVTGEWDGLLAGVQGGRYDLMANGVGYTEDRAQAYYFSDFYAFNRTVLVVRGDNDEIHSLEDLQGKTTCNSANSTYQRLAESYGATVKDIETLDGTIEELLDEYMPRDCVLDLSGLDFMDSSGIAVIIKVSRRMKTMGGRAWIENPAKQPQRVIDAAGIDRLVPVALGK